MRTGCGSIGVVAVDSLSAGNVRIEAFDPMSAQQMARLIELRSGTDLEADLALHPGVPVVVAVKGPGNRPIEGARVTVRRADGVPLFANLSRFKHTREAVEAAKADRSELPNVGEVQKRVERSLEFTDANGRLAVFHLIPGDYVITATAPGYKPWKKTVRIGSGASQTVEIVLEKE
jgi:hypothetical protein